MQIIDSKLNIGTQQKKNKLSKVTKKLEESETNATKVVVEVNAEVIPTAKIVMRSRQIVLSSDGKTEGFSFSVTYFFTVSFSFSMLCPAIQRYTII